MTDDSDEESGGGSHDRKRGETWSRPVRKTHRMALGWRWSLLGPPASSGGLSGPLVQPEEIGGSDPTVQSYCSIPLFIGQTGRIAVRYRPMPARHSENPRPTTRFFHYTVLWVHRQRPPGLHLHNFKRPLSAALRLLQRRPKAATRPPRGHLYHQKIPGCPLEP